MGETYNSIKYRLCKLLMYPERHVRESISLGKTSLEKCFHVYIILKVVIFSNPVHFTFP